MLTSNAVLPLQDEPVITPRKSRTTYFSSRMKQGFGERRERFKNKGIVKYEGNMRYLQSRFSIII